MGKESASPQLENGFTRLANELLEALSRVRLSPYAHSVILAIIRETYGYHVKSWPLAVGRLAKITGISRPHVHRALCQLEQKNIITCLGTAKELGLVGQKGKRKFDPRTKVWRLQKDYLQWKGYREVVAPTGTKLLPVEALSCYQQRHELGVHKDKERKGKIEEREKTPPPSKKKRRSKSSRKGRKRDPRLDHPALKIYRALAHLTAPAAMRDDMIGAYQEQGEARWGWAVKEWIGRGYNPRNLLGMIDVCRNGFRDEKGGQDGEDGEDRAIRHKYERELEKA